MHPYRNGYQGVVSLETHWRPQGSSGEEASRHSFTGLLALTREVSDAATGGV